MKHGDFSGLAKSYSSFRPDYSQTILQCLISMLPKPIGQIDFVDVGGGTGIWTRMVGSRQPQSITVVEPNADMRAHGIQDSHQFTISWLGNPAEATGLADQSCDWLTMASSFHWTDFGVATKEFFRVLRPGGCFTALWNPRFIQSNPLLVEIEAFLANLVPDMKRVSSGTSEFTRDLTEKLLKTGLFEDVVYLEGRHTIEMPPERYIGIWQSVNDIQVQAGPKRFAEFLDFLESRTKGLSAIKADYLTKAWNAKRKPHAG